MAELVHNAEEAIQWTKKHIARSAVWGMVLLVASLFVNYGAGTYASENASSAVHDLILDHLPIVNVNGIFAGGIILVFIFVVCIGMYQPHRIPFVAKSLSLFIVIRSFFVILTHIGPILPATVYHVPTSIDEFTFTGDLFFSAHTGIPFLMALIFWRTTTLRYIFLALSIMFGAVVLLGHLHYSIDVFSAFFITYGIVHIAQWLFAKDFRLFTFYAARKH